jgi:hypothetical protein
VFAEDLLSYAKYKICVKAKKVLDFFRRYVIIIVGMSRGRAKEYQGGYHYGL